MTVAHASLPSGPDDGLAGAVLELTVGAVAHGGCCVAHADDGIVVLVRHALPGERVRAVVTEQHRSYLRADAVEILDASSHRVSAPCPYAGPGRCGGCDLQHADLAYQRELKASVVREQLRRLAGLDVAEPGDSPGPLRELTVRPLPAVPGRAAASGQTEPDGQGWRTRVQYTVDSTGRAGLLVHRSHEVVPVDRCLIAHATVRDADVLARDWPVHDGLEAIAGAEGLTLLGRRGSGPPVVVSGPASVTERAVGRDWRLPPTAFWQVHPAAADTLASTVVELLQPRPGDRIWDLYGGAGLFAAALAPHAASTGRITVVEGDPAAVAAARDNLRDLTTVTVLHADVARFAVQSAASARSERQRAPRSRANGHSGRAVDLVVLDPPRAGAGPAVVAAIVAHAPRAVAYVACDPAALARDLRTLRSYGYELAQLRAYDLFPHTHHVECVALLQGPAAAGRGQDG